ncbi:MAG TPA: Gfo/Idh/MocA family oxidoreductase, partial [Gemmataceae bacterium]
LHLHAPAAIDAMKAGAERGRPIHVLCEKLMARTIPQCKEMIKTARETGSILSIGHQRHYSLLYAHALEVMNSGVLGDVRHIRALWHRNNSWPYEPKPGEVDYAALKLRAPHYRDGWFQPIYEIDYAALGDKDLSPYGYDDIDQLIRWRLYNKTGGGLMAELGSHQLDACSIFLGKVKPLSVQGVGVKSFYRPGENDRSCDDHVFCTYEFPGPNHPKGPKGGDDPNDIVVVTYSSVNTNGFENYGECVMGTRGTMIVESEQSVLLYTERAPGGGPPRGTQVTVSTVGADKAALEAAASYAAPQAAGTPTAAAEGPVSRGYREEMEDFAYCVRLWDPKLGYEKDSDGKFRQRLPRCHGEIAMADAILALTANLAMETRQRIEFKPEWFDWDNPAVPDEGMDEKLKNLREEFKA